MADTAELEQETGKAGVEVSPPLEEVVRPSAAQGTLDWMTTTLPRAQAERADILGRKIGAESAISRRMMQRDEETRVEQKRALDATAIQPGELQPWDQNAAYEKYKTNPLESFGSLGSVFAMLAAGFTKAPMTNALNAGAAAMNAIKDGNDQEYDRAFKAFKENTDLALKRHNILQQRYNDIDKLRSSDMTSWRSQAAAIASQFDDQSTLSLINSGMDKEALSAIHSRIGVAKDLEALRDSDMDRSIKVNAFEALKAQIKEKTDDPAQQAAYTIAAHDLVFNKKAAQPENAAYANYLMQGGLFETTEQQLAKAAELKRRSSHASVDAFQAETAKALSEKYIAEGMHPADARSRGLREATSDASKAAAGRAVTNQKREELAEAGVADFERATGTKATPLIQGIIRKAYLAEGSMSGMRLAQVGHAIDEIQKLAPEARTPERISELMTHAFQAKPTISDQAADIEGDLFITGNPKSIAARARAGTGVDAANIQKARNAAYKTLNDLGMNSEEASAFLNAQAADYKASMASATSIGQRIGGLAVNMELVKKTAENVKELSEKVPRSEFPTLNAVYNAAAQGTGGTDIVEFRAALRTFLAEYSRAIMGGNAMLSVHAQKKAEEQLSEAFSHDQTVAAVNQIVKEVTMIQEGARSAQKFWRDGIAAAGRFRNQFTPVDELPGYSIREK